MEEILNSSFVRKKREELIHIPTELPIRFGIFSALKAMKNGKAGGADNIPAEVLKVDTYTGCFTTLGHNCRR